jgi:hypothetical protein
MRLAIAETIRNAMLAAVANQLDGGTVRIYADATAAPATPEDAIPDGSIVLVEFAIGTPSEDDISGGEITFGAVGPSAALASGVASWARISRPDDTGVFDGDVGTDDSVAAFIIGGTTDVVIDAQYILGAWAFALPALVET